LSRFLRAFDEEYEGEDGIKGGDLNERFKPMPDHVTIASRKLGKTNPK